MKSNKLKILFVIIFSCVYNIYGQVGLDKLAQSTMNFLLVSVSPKASAMGDASFAISEGAESIFYNPAGLAETPHTYDVALNYTQWIADINYLGGAFAYNLGSIGSFGVHVLTVDYGTINGTRLIDPSQKEQYPLGYIDIGKLGNVGAFSVGLSYAKKINQQFAIGGNIRYVGQSLGDNLFNDGTSKSNDATKLVFDAGVMYDTGYKGFRFGMAIRNFASNIKREEIDEQLPLTFSLGTAINLMDAFFDGHDENTSLLLAVDYLHSNNYSERMNFGLEYKVLGMIFLRGGYQTNRNLASWSGGLGFEKSISDYVIDVSYSYSQMEIFDNVNRLSIGFSF